MIQISSLSEIDAATVQEQQLTLTQFLQETYPNIDLGRGVMHDLVQYVNAIFLAKMQKEMERWQNSKSLLAITQNPELADTDTVDNLLSNYRITRKAGSTATGSIVLEFSEDNAVIIPRNTSFTCGSVKFIITQSFLVYASTSQHTALADRVLTPLESGNFGCTIPITAVESGIAGVLSKNDILTPGITITGLVTVYAADNFVGGSDAETNEQLLSRMASGIATPCWGNRENIKSLIISKNLIPDLVDVAVIGHGDPEMRRDTNGVIPVSTGGKIDVYAKTASSIQSITTNITATVISTDCNGVYWRVIITSSILPGFWRVSSVLPSNSYNSATFTITSQTVRSNNAEYPDDEVAYTPYQDVILEFITDPDTSKTVGSKDTFNITVIGVPDITVLSDALKQDSIKPITSDVLVRSAIPCLLDLAIILQQSKNHVITETQQAEIRSAITSYINNTGFCGNITTANIAPYILKALDTSQSIQQIQITGAILLPNGKVWRDSSSRNIQIPIYNEQSVSPNTTAFFIDAASIDITVRTV